MMWCKVTLFLLALITLSGKTAKAYRTSLAMRPHGVTEELILLQYLMANYTSLSRPVRKSSEAVLVQSRLFPIKILNMTWKDRMLVWYPPDFHNQSTIVIPGGKLWIPDLQIVNSVSDLYALLRDHKFDFKVHKDGSVWWHPTGNLVTRCELQLMFFPFDFQRCPIILESAIYSHKQMNLTIRFDKSPVSLSMYAVSGHWDLLKVTGSHRVLWVTNSTAFTRVEFWLVLGRKTTYFKMNIIFPCCMLSGLQMLTFFFPLESTERVPEATSILLSVIVFQTMIVDQLPRSSNSIPLLCIYVDMLTGISVLAVAEAVIVASLVSRKGTRTKAPKWAHGFLKFIYRWNTDKTRARWHGRGRASLKFFRNSFARFETRRKRNFEAAKKTNSEAIALDNINSAKFRNASDDADFDLHNKSRESILKTSGEPSPYQLRTQTVSFDDSSLKQELLAEVQSQPLPAIKPAQPIIKFLPGERRGISENSSNMDIDNSENRGKIRKIEDAPLADFDPDSSIMMTSSVFGGPDLSAAPPHSLILVSSMQTADSEKTLTADSPTFGQIAVTTFTQLPSIPTPDLFVDDQSPDKTLQDSRDLFHSSVEKKLNELPTSMPSLSSISSKIIQPLPESRSSTGDTTSRPSGSNVDAELSPLLAPRFERVGGCLKKTDQNEPSTTVVRWAASSSRSPNVETLAKTSSVSTATGGERSTGKPSLTLSLPGIPRHAQRHRSSLFIPAEDNDDIILDWIYLAKVLDGVMFVLCLTVVIVVPVVLFSILPPTSVD